MRSNVVESDLIRFPALDADLLRNKIEQFIDRYGNRLERDNYHANNPFE
jgi:hypothetical protein